MFIGILSEPLADLGDVDHWPNSGWVLRWDYES